jgi:hypothetical protein
MSSEPKFPLVPQVEYPNDFETDQQLHGVKRAAILAGDSRGQIEAQLDQAHRAMVYRDSMLARLVAAVQDGKGDSVLHRASMHAFWHGELERNVEAAGDIARRLTEPTAQQEAER